MKVKLFAAPKFSDRPAMRFVEEKSSTADSSALFKGLPNDYSITGFEFVRTIAECDYVLIPQFVKYANQHWLSYFEPIKTDAKRHGKEVIVFIGGDLGYRSHIDGALCFVRSTFRHVIRDNEIACPGFVEDLSETYGLPIRSKHQTPVVSFCGFAGFKDFKTHAKYIIKNLALDGAAIVTRNPKLKVYKRGIYFRRRAMCILEKNFRVETSFIVRQTFSGNTSSIELDPQKARADYVANMLDSDFVLSPKGDGNYSARFFEALSLGRIPLVVDTDMVLPLEKTIDYSKFCLRVSHTQLHQLGNIVADFYDSLTDEQFVAMQKAAREAFRKYLRYDSYFNFALPLLKEKGIQSLR
jgi:hypothetical protein